MRPSPDGWYPASLGRWPHCHCLGGPLANGQVACRECKASSRGCCGVLLGGIEMWADDVLLHLHQVWMQLDIFAESRASACTNKRSVLKKEMTSVHLAERLANMVPEQELWTSYPLGAQEARARLPRGLLCDTPCRFARLPGVSPPIGL